MTLPSSLTFKTCPHYVTSQLEKSSRPPAAVTSPLSLKTSVQGLVVPGRLPARRTTTAALPANVPRQRNRTCQRIEAQAASTGVATTTLTWEEIMGATDWAGLVGPRTPGGRNASANEDLVKEVVKYGNLTQATYDGFIQEKSPDENAPPKVLDYYTAYGGRNMYTKAELLDESLPTLDSYTRNQIYTIEKYLHSTSGFAGILCDRASAKYKKLADKTERQIWAGYVGYKLITPAAGETEIEIVVAFRGTQLMSEWVSNLDLKQSPWLGYGSALVHDGFQQIYRDDPKLRKADDTFFKQFDKNEKTLAPADGSPQSDVRQTILNLATIHKVRNIVVIGHSLGAALASICALDVAQFLKNDKKAQQAFKSYAALPPVTAFPFASPRVGNGNFAKLFDLYNVKVLRSTDIYDLVPMVPGKLSAEDEKALAEFSGRQILEALAKCDELQQWVEIGSEMKVSYKESKILKYTNDLNDIWRYHNLGCYLYLISTQLGTQKPPVKGVLPGPHEFDYRICDKLGDTLIPEFSTDAVPPLQPAWWTNRPDNMHIPSNDIENS